MVGIITLHDRDYGYLFDHAQVHELAMCANIITEHNSTIKNLIEDWSEKDKN